MQTTCSSAPCGGRRSILAIVTATALALVVDATITMVRECMADTVEVHIAGRAAVAMPERLE